MKITVEMDVPEDHENIAMVRQFARTLLEHRRAAPADVDDIEAVVGELCANVTRHARSQVGCFHVTLEHHGGHVVLEVSDHGQGLDRAGLPAVGEARPDEDGTERFGGFGLHLVDSLTDRVEFSQSDPTGTTVRAHKTLQDARQDTGVSD